MAAPRTPYGPARSFSVPVPTVIMRLPSLFLLASFLTAASHARASVPNETATHTFGGPDPTMAPTVGSPTTDSPAATTSNTSAGNAAGSVDGGNPSHTAFNYFFLLIAGIGVVLFMLLLYYSNRRRLRRAQQTNGGRVALARDIEAWGRAGVRYGGSRRHPRDAAGGVHREEGTDERGEAPPSYESVGADKPPSLRHVERQVRGSVDSARDVELSDLSPEGAAVRGHPPGYVHTGGNTVVGPVEEVDLGDMMRPTAHGQSSPEVQVPEQAAAEGTRWKKLVRLIGSGVSPGSSASPGC